MSCSSLRRRVLAVALVATGGLVSPAVAGPAPALAAPASVAAAPLQTAVDTDGDGLDDATDGCPSVASGNPTGCPSASRRLTLERIAGTRRLVAQVTSPVPACVTRARIKLFLDTSSGADKLLASDASPQGRSRFTVSGGARYYALVAPSYSSGVAECGRAVSRTVRIPR